MSNNCLKQSLRNYSAPVLFLVSVCVIFGVAFLPLDTGATVAFGLAAITAAVTFGILGARDDCRARNPPRQSQS